MDPISEVWQIAHMTNDHSQIKRIAQTIRVLSAEGVQRANSGHPGMPMGAADYAAYLWAKELRINGADPGWINRDRFILSAGHGSMLLYSLLHLFGFDLPMSELKRFRQWESKTPGHPEFGWTSGVETTTGPLGQGFANGVGIALSGKLLAESYGKDLFNYRVFGIVSDGDLMEGVASEAASLAGHLALDNLVYFYDDNEISIGGSTDVCFTEDVGKRFESYGWFVQKIDGHNLDQISAALERALVANNGKPSIIIARTTIGLGSPNKSGTAEVHGSPLGKEELALTKKQLGWTETEEFSIPADVSNALSNLIKEKQTVYDSWQKSYQNWRSSNPERSKELDKQLSREIPSSLFDDLVQAATLETKPDATRNLSGKAIQVIAKKLPYFIGGSADLEPSTKTLIKGSEDIGPGAFKGRNVRFGVREHGMGSLVNGLSYGRCWIPYSATFLVFADYMRPPIRLAALSHLQSLFIFTHDSFWVGEDGPTHEPIEQIASLRIIPNLYVFRPADALETNVSYFAALELKERPSALLFTRQNVPPLARENSDPRAILKGGYVVSGSSESDLVLIATGSEVWVALEASLNLAKSGVKSRVVSLPCLELFNEQPVEYKESIIPRRARKVSIEAGSTYGWERVIGTDGLAIGIDHYGASAPGEELADKFGFTPQAVSSRVLEWLKGR